MKALATLALLLSLSVQAAAAPTLVALLLNPEANAAKKRAVVEIKVAGIALQDPAGAPGPHLLIRLDQETPVATAQTRVSFHGLGPGAHTITVVLVDGDDKPLGAEDAVWLSVSRPQ